MILDNDKFHKSPMNLSSSEGTWSATLDSLNWWCHRWVIHILFGFGTVFYSVYLKFEYTKLGIIHQSICFFFHKNDVRVGCKNYIETIHHTAQRHISTSETHCHSNLLQKVKSCSNHDVLNTYHTKLEAHYSKSKPKIF